MVFVTISKSDFRYGEGVKIDKDTIKKNHAVTLCFYDSESIQADFGNYGWIDAREISEPTKSLGDKPLQKF
jgi:hypothetical protein